MTRHGYRSRAVRLLAAIPLLAAMGLLGISPSFAAVSTGSVTFHKTVDNSAGGSASAADFKMTLASTDGGQTYSGNASGDTIEVLADTYTLTETSLPNYTSVYGGGCYNPDTQAGTGATVTVAEGDAWICGFTNTYVAPATATVTFLKEVDNSAGGSASPGDFAMTLTGDQTYDDNHSGDTINVVPGTYTLTETSLPGYISVYGGGCYNTDTQANTGDVVTFGAGESWVCGFANTYVPGSTPTPTPTPTAKPSVTPPPTTTGAVPPTGGSQAPLFVLLICLAFAGLGLAAVSAQRKTMR